MNDSLLIAADSCTVSSGLHLFPPLLTWLSTGSEPTRRGATTRPLATLPWTLSTGKNNSFIFNKSRIPNKQWKSFFLFFSLWIVYFKKLQSLDLFPFCNVHNNVASAQTREEHILGVSIHHNTCLIYLDQQKY